MNTRPVLTLFLIAALAGASSAATSQVYKWVDSDGSVHYGDSASRSKNARAVEGGSGTVSVVPGISKEEIERLRKREEESRLQRLEREVEELRAREQTRASAPPEIVVVESYVPVFGVGRPIHRRPHRDVKPRPSNPSAHIRPPGWTPELEATHVTRPHAGNSTRR